MAAKLLAVLVLVCSLAGPAFAGADEDAVAHLLHSTFDKPEAKLVVEPVVVNGDYAIAGWTQAEMGGRALLKRKDARWQLVLCSDDQLKSAETLAHVGLSPSAARLLASQLSQAEAKTDPKRITLFSRFDGIVMMGADGHHSQH